MPDFLSSGMFIHGLLLAGSNCAYIDPNAGGLLFQLLFPLFVAIAGAWMVLRKKVGALRQRWLDRKNKKSDDPS